MESILIKDQKKTFRREFIEGGQEYVIVATLRYDDRCGNGHNTFSATADVYRVARSGELIDDRFGCLHDDIRRYFPELTKYLKWHLCSSDYPLHYIANTLYHASNKDCHGYHKGEACSWDHYFQFGDFPGMTKIKNDMKNLRKYIEENRIDWATVSFKEVPHINRPGDNYNFSPKYCFDLPYAKDFTWYDCEFDSLAEIKQFADSAIWCNGKITIHKIATDFSKGKEPDLDAARCCAIAPRATLEQLQSREWLLARLPKLQARFRRAMIRLGFVW